MPVTPDQFADLTATSLAGGAGGLGTPLNSGDTTLLIPSGIAAMYPTSGPFMVLLGVDTLGSCELVKCTSRSSNTLTIVRAQEGTTAQTWVVGTPVEQTLTAGNLANIWNPISHAVAGIYNVMDYGAAGDGTTDDTSAIQSAITAAASNGGRVFVPGGHKYLVSSPLTISHAGIDLYGDGRDTSIILPSTIFSGAEIISITANNCRLSHLGIAYASSTTSGNPSANGIELTGAQYCILEDLELDYINGYAIESLASSSVINLGTMISHVHTLSCASGIHVKSNNTGSNGFGAYHSITNNQIDSTTTGDCLLLEDSNHILLENFFGKPAQGSATNSGIHIKGPSSDIYMTNIDLHVGVTANAPVVLIESDGFGSPSSLNIQGGLITGGTYGVSVTAGSQIRLSHLDISSNATYGANVTGSSTDINFLGCIFSANGQTAASNNYDANLTTSGRTRLEFCEFLTPQGTSAGDTAHAVNFTTGALHIIGCCFAGTGYTTGNIFGGTPTVGLDNVVGGSTIVNQTLSGLTLTGTLTVDGASSLDNNTITTDGSGDMTMKEVIFTGVSADPTTTGTSVGRIHYNNSTDTMVYKPAQASSVAAGHMFQSWTGSAGVNVLSIGGQYASALSWIDNTANHVLPGGAATFYNGGTGSGASVSWVNASEAMAYNSFLSGGSATGHYFASWTGSGTVIPFAVGGQFAGASSWVDSSGNYNGPAGGGIPTTRNGTATSVPIFTGTGTPSSPPTGSVWIKA